MDVLWDWVQQSRRERQECREWYREWDHAFELAQANPEEAIALFDSLLARVEQAGDPWWRLFLVHWKLQISIHYLRDYESAIHDAVKATLEVRGSHFHTFPQRVCLHEDLVHAYHGLDPIGYAPLIHDALEYMTTEIISGSQCESCLRGLRTDFFRSIEHPQALDVAWEQMRLAEGQYNQRHYAHSYVEVCYTLAITKGYAARRELGDLAKTGQELMTKFDSTFGLHEIAMWRAVAARWNEEPDAPELYERALEARARFGGAARMGYYEAAVMFHEASADFRGALQIIETELVELEGSGEVWRESLRRLKKCELLQHLGLPVAEEADKVREVSQKLKALELIEAKLAALRL